MRLQDSSADDVSRIELSRDELLAEMGLGPVWHLRGGEPEEAVECVPVPEAPAPVVETPVMTARERMAAIAPPAPAEPAPEAPPVRPAVTPRQSAADAVAAARALLSKGRSGGVTPPPAFAPAAASQPGSSPAPSGEENGGGFWDDGEPPMSAYADGFVTDADDDREPLPPDDFDFSAPESGVSPAEQRAGEIATLDWDGLEARIRNCRDCSLCEQRKQAVPGVGDRRPDWLFIGEGPGADEDAQGEPFVGQAGKLLDAMLAAIDLKRGNKVYIANAVKCRPPGNRTPAADEIATCWPYLQRQIALLQPKLIVLLGRPAVSAVLGGEASIASLRGKRLDYQGTPVLVSYHPAYLLRNLPDKAKAWEDLCRARVWMRELQAS